MKHVIRKQLIALQLAAGHDAFTVQQKAKDYFYDHLAPALDKVLTELSPPGEMISVDRIEIDLGDLGWKNEKLIADRDHIYRVLKESFVERLSAINGVQQNRESPVTVSSLPAHACMQWIYYMENGVLPWALQHTRDEWLEQVLHQLAIDHASVEKIKDSIKQHHWFLSRIISDHKEEYLQQLAGVITARPQPRLMNRIEAIARQQQLPAQQYHSCKNKLWAAALLQFAEGKTTYMPEETQPYLPLAHKRSEIPEEVPSILQEGIFCSFAGVVLLHPFFKHLFNHLLLLENGVFANDAAKAKGVLLIYYIATGNTNAKDHELVAAKTLCGMPLREVLETDELTGQEKQEAENMIQAAIAQWSIIQNTSIEGLREGFLSRQGKLVQQQTGITFTLETSGIDVLLDHLPWNLSIIKFPWLNHLIRVEWR